MKTSVRCEICPYLCKLAPMERGICGARINKNGIVIAENYGRITSMALDPIEKKPLRMYKPGSNILSIGSYGCNLTCSFCQNYRISMVKESPDYIEMLPEQVLSQAIKYLDMKNIGIAYTYNEPLVGYEFVRDCAQLIKEAGLDNIVVTNGFINEKPFLELLPLIDGFNIDLKAFNQKFYKGIGGNLEVVKNTITNAVQKTHVEVTCLIIEGENDDREEMKEMASWLSSLDRKIPFHISRFFPAYEMSNKKATKSSTIKELGQIAREYLDYVFLGNL